MISLDFIKFSHICNVNKLATARNIVKLWFLPEMEQNCQCHVPQSILLNVGALQCHVGALQLPAAPPRALHRDSSLDLPTAAQKSQTVAKITIWSGQFFFQPIQYDWIQV